MSSWTRPVRTLIRYALWLCWGAAGVAQAGQQAAKAPNLPKAVRQEATRLLDEFELPERARSLGPVALHRMRNHLQDCYEALDQDAAQLGLRHLAEAKLEMARAGFLAEHPKVESLEELRNLSAEHPAMGQALEELAAARGQRPAALQALLEVSWGRATRYLHSAPSYGAEANLAAGLHYLAVGHSYYELSRFVAQLPYTPVPRGLGSLPGLSTYQGRLEAEVAALYQPPLSRSHGAEFVGISSLLKLARQLQAEGAVAGALELTLDAQAQLARFSKPQASSLDDVEASLDGLFGSFQGAAVDHSLGKLLWHRASSDLRRVAMEEDGSLGDIQIFMETVLPRYFACLADQAQEASGGEPVTITLVRWPFT